MAKKHEIKSKKNYLINVHKEEKADCIFLLVKAYNLKLLY